MKKIIYIGILVQLALVFISCSDSSLDVIPRNQLSDATFWKTENDADLALTGCYKGWEGAENVAFLDAASDNGLNRDEYGYKKMGNGQLTASNYQQGSWVNATDAAWFKYDNIRKYNTFLANIGNIKMDATKKERYKAEVRFLRAYNYFNKVMFFGDVPLVTDLILQDAKLPRDPVEKVQAFILSELSDIIQVLPEQNNIESKGHITKGAALALKARLELFLGKYDDAMNDADAVIKMSCYELYPDYRRLFLPESKTDNKESILEVQFKKDDYKNMIPQLMLPLVDLGWFELCASKSMVDAYETTDGTQITDAASNYNPDKPFDNRDPRLNMTLICAGQKWNGRYFDPLNQKTADGKINQDYVLQYSPFGSGIYVKKFCADNMDVSYMNNYDTNFMVIRLAEMYLTYAEAAIETGKNKDIALTLINNIRTRSGQVDAKILTKDLVRNERRIELAFEGLRYFDIKRWDIGKQVLNGTFYGTRLGTMDYTTGAITWTNEYVKVEERIFIPERKYLLPIPQTEMDANPNMKQNPGY